MSELRNLDISNISKYERKLILDYAVAERKAEIDRFWSRTVTFWGFVVASFVAYAALFDKQNSAIPRIVLILFGLVCSFCWTLSNRGGFYWQRCWENKVNIIEKEVLNVDLFSNKEPILEKDRGFWGARRYSVSRLITAMSDLTTSLWIMLLLHQISTLRDKTAISFVTILSGVAALYGLAIFQYARSRD